jgi:MerR family redox-sensitive transcriptional activator SoxR
MPARSRAAARSGSRTAKPNSDAALAIGEVARRAGLNASAVRYYERIGLLPRPPRASGQRRYDPSILEWLSLIALARAAGFTMAEVKKLVSGFSPGTRPAARWAELATRKLAALDETIARTERMRDVLRIALDCGCFRLEDCRALLDAGPVDRQSPCVLPTTRPR